MMTQYEIIDISHHNGIVDFKQVSKTEIAGVIIRAGYGKVVTQKDKQFENNYKNAKANNLFVGAYWYSYAENTAEAKLEALTFLDVIKNKTFELPLYFDIEEPKHLQMGKQKCTDIVKAFCDTIENAGYFCGVYSFDSFFTTNLDKSIFDRYSLWIARVDGKKPQSCNAYDMWQYSWKEKVKGISGDVDVNECYKDFPKIIKNAGLNGFNKSDKYKIIAEINNISENQADKIKTECLNLGMSVKKEKEV